MLLNTLYNLIVRSWRIDLCLGVITLKIFQRKIACRLVTIAICFIYYSSLDHTQFEIYFLSLWSFHFEQWISESKTLNRSCSSLNNRLSIFKLVWFCFNLGKSIHLRDLTIHRWDLINSDLVRSIRTYC